MDCGAPSVRSSGAAPDEADRDARQGRASFRMAPIDGTQVAVHGSFWEGLRPSRPAPAINNEFFRWKMRRRICPGNLARAPFVRDLLIIAHSNLVNAEMLAVLRAVLLTSETSIQRAMTQHKTPRNASMAGQNRPQAENAVSAEPRADRVLRNARASNVHLRGRKNRRVQASPADSKPLARNRLWSPRSSGQCE